MGPRRWHCGIGYFVIFGTAFSLGACGAGSSGEQIQNTDGLPASIELNKAETEALVTSAFAASNALTERLQSLGSSQTLSSEKLSTSADKRSWTKAPIGPKPAEGASPSDENALDVLSSVGGLGQAANGGGLAGLGIDIDQIKEVIFDVVPVGINYLTLKMQTALIRDGAFSACAYGSGICFSAPVDEKFCDGLQAPHIAACRAQFEAGPWQVHVLGSVVLTPNGPVFVDTGEVVVAQADDVVAEILKNGDLRLHFPKALQAVSFGILQVRQADDPLYPVANTIARTAPTSRGSVRISTVASRAGHLDGTALILEGEGIDFAVPYKWTQDADTQWVQVHLAGRDDVPALQASHKNRWTEDVNVPELDLTIDLGPSSLAFTLDSLRRLTNLAIADHELGHQALLRLDRFGADLSLFTDRVEFARLAVDGRITYDPQQQSLEAGTTILRVEVGDGSEQGPSLSLNDAVVLEVAPRLEAKTSFDLRAVPHWAPRFQQTDLQGFIKLRLEPSNGEDPSLQVKLISASKRRSTGKLRGAKLPISKFPVPSIWQLQLTAGELYVEGGDASGVPYLKTVTAGQCLLGPAQLTIPTTVKNVFRHLRAGRCLDQK